MNVSCALGLHCLAVTRPGGSNIGPGLPLLVVLLIAAAGYGATRLRRRRRGGRVADSTWRPERQASSSTGAVAPSGDRAAAPVPAAPDPAAPRAARAVGLLGGTAGGWAVETHGLTKLGARDRTQLVILAYQSGLATQA